MARVTSAIASSLFGTCALTRSSPGYEHICDRRPWARRAGSLPVRIIVQAGQVAEAATHRFGRWLEDGYGKRGYQPARDGRRWSRTAGLQELHAERGPLHRAVQRDGGRRPR